MCAGVCVCGCFCCGCWLLVAVVVVVVVVVAVASDKPQQDIDWVPHFLWSDGPCVEQVAQVTSHPLMREAAKNPNACQCMYGMFVNIISPLGWFQAF